MKDFASNSTQLQKSAVWLLVLYSAFGALFTGAVVGVILTMGTASEPTEFDIVGTLFTVAILLIPIVHGIGFVAGASLLRGRETAHKYAVVCSLLYLLNFPVGTIVGGLYLYASRANS